MCMLDTIHAKRDSLNAIFSQGVDVIDRGGVREGSPFARMIEKDLVAV